MYITEFRGWLEYSTTNKNPKIVKNLLIHLTQPFKYYSIKGSDYKQAIHSRYYIKAYNKSLQYKKEDEIFRFEIKYKRMLALNNLNIRTLDDLNDPNKLRLALENAIRKVAISYYIRSNFKIRRC